MRGQYRKPFNFKMETLRTAARHVRRYQEAAERVEEVLSQPTDHPEGPDVIGEDLDGYYRDTLNAMCSDLNTPAATAAALEGLGLIESKIKNDTLTVESAESAREWFSKINSLLGIVAPEHAPDERTAASVSTDDEGGDDFEDAIEELIDERSDAREEGDYERADAIRDTLEAMGIEIMDSPEGTTWRRKTAL
jgi:cysteinyl-tRNA synthetase